jgi:hypothetical protein
MDDTTILIIALAVLVVAIVAAFLFMRQRRAKLQSRFGPEYSRTIEEAGDRHQAESELRDREKRVRKYDIRPLTTADKDRFAGAWRRVQTEFVDNPKGAVSHADDLVGEVMSARGYPVTEFDQAADDLSVDHPVVVQNYRSAHDIALRHKRGDAGTEDLRQAMIHYRALVDDLIERTEPIRKAS